MDRDLDRLFGEGALARFWAAGEIACGLPAAAYTSAAFFERERTHLFPEAWTFVGFAHELAQPGDVAPVEVGGQPLLLVRTRKGDLKAFHNVCRHRCSKLVDRPGNVGRVITCPYHAWAYGLDGELRTTPHFAGPDAHEHAALARGGLGLVPVRLGQWQDWIFVNLSGRAPAFEEAVAPLARRLAGVDFATMTPVATLDFGEVRCNWKLLMENFIEPYHVQFVHKTTTEQPLTDHSTFIDGNCLGSAVELSGQNGGAGGGETLAVNSWYLTLFPNFVLGRYHPDQIGVHLNVPLGPDRTAQRRVIYHTGPEAPSAEAVAQLETLWWDVHKEDHGVCERMQAGRASAVAADGGLLSPHWENSLRRFQELVLEAVTAREARP